MSQYERLTIENAIKLHSTPIKINIRTMNSKTIELVIKEKVNIKKHAFFMLQENTVKVLFDQLLL